MGLVDNCSLKVIENCQSKAASLSLWHPSSPSLSFSQFFDQLVSVQSSLGGRLEKGDYALLAIEVCPALYTLTTALLAKGITIILVEPWMPLERIERIISNLNPVPIASRIGQIWGARVAAVRSIPNWIYLGDLIEKNRLSKDLDLIEKSKPSTQRFSLYLAHCDSKGVVRTHAYLQDQYSVLDRLLNLSHFEGPDLCIFANFAMANLVAGRASLLIPSAWRKNISRADLYTSSGLQAAYYNCKSLFPVEVSKLWVSRLFKRNASWWSYS